MRISIAMATYNGERFIREQLDSLARQTYLPHELVVTDDGSTDHTLPILEDFKTTAPFPVRIYPNERNLGFANNFLKAATLCEGDWIAFCDQDDVWYENKLVIIGQVLQRSNNIVMAFHSADLCDESLIKTGRRQPDILRFQIIPPLNARLSFVASGFASVVHSDVIRCTSYQDRPKTIQDLNYSHDWWCYLLANAFGGVAYIPDSLCAYRRHSSALTGFYDDKPPTPWRRLRSGCPHCEEMAHATIETSHYLTQHVSDVPEQYAETITKAVRYYAALSSWFVHRRTMYLQNQPMTEKYACFLRLLCHGAYLGRDGWRFGFRSMVKDFVNCITPTF